MKSKRIIITGPPNSGKSRLAEQLMCIVKDYVHVDFVHVDDPFFLSPVVNGTEGLLIENITDLNKVFKLLNGFYLVIDKPYEESIVVNIPFMVFVCEDISPYRIDKRYFTIIDLGKTETK